MVSGAAVHIKEPFTAAFPDACAIGSVEGTTAFLDGIPEGFTNAFTFEHMEVICE